MPCEAAYMISNTTSHIENRATSQGKIEAKYEEVIL